MYDYSTIKQVARENGLRIGDLLALAPSNDPFYTGRPSEIAAAQWFYDLWARFGYDHGVHLRRIHYQAVSQQPQIEMPNGKGPYENTIQCWNYLNNAAKWARYLGLVPAESFVDRRNPDAIITRYFEDPTSDWHEDPTPGYEVVDLADWEEITVPEVPQLPCLPEALPETPTLEPTGYYSIEQPYLIEIWAEKTTMNDVLLPLCRNYHVNLVTGAGELSITAVLSFLARVRASGLPARILYVSDFDPAGLGMPISVARKIEYYQRKGDYDGLDIHLDPIVLTADQVAYYDLPRVPVKNSDKRKANFEKAYGEGQVELDALEALHPGELHDIAEQAILDYYDPSLHRRALDVKYELRNRLGRETARVESDHIAELEEISMEWEDLVVDYNELRREFEERVAEYTEVLDAYAVRIDNIKDRAQDEYSKLRDDLESTDVDLDDYALPDPDLPDEDGTQLYESHRSYGDQLMHYKAQRHNAQQLTLEVN